VQLGAAVGALPPTTAERHSGRYRLRLSPSSSAPGLAVNLSSFQHVS
jgi:hypothetical protein